MLACGASWLHRSLRAGLPWQEDHLSHEIDPDDVEVMGIDEGMGEEAGHEEDLCGLEPQNRDFIVMLWPFAFSRAYYKHMFTSLCGHEGLSHLVVLTTSAHPAPALAAHDLKLTTHILLDCAAPLAVSPLPTFSAPRGSPHKPTLLVMSLGPRWRIPCPAGPCDQAQQGPRPQSPP